MSDFEVHIELNGKIQEVGLARSNRPRGAETILFDFAAAWLNDPNRLTLEPALALTRGAFAPPAGQAIFGSIGDSAPDTWGRRLMQRAERRQVEREGRAIRTLVESNYLLGVSDQTRLGALRFRRPGEDVFQAPMQKGVPALMKQRGSLAPQDPFAHLRLQGLARRLAQSARSHCAGGHNCFVLSPPMHRRPARHVESARRLGCARQCRRG
jgi:hypothetical protein